MTPGWHRPKVSAWAAGRSRRPVARSDLELRPAGPPRYGCSGRLFECWHDRASAESHADRCPLQVSGLQNCGARSPQTAHQLDVSRIHYRFHPYFDCEVEIIRRQRADNSTVMIRIVEVDLKISVPAWMLDRIACRDLILQSVAKIELNAIQELREVVDLQLAAISVNNKGSQLVTGEPNGEALSTDSPADA
jgi:hypothetical protein